MSNRVSRLLHADWPEYISYDKAPEVVDNFYSIIDGATTNKNSIFYKKRLIDIFILAMAIGVEMGMKKKLTKRSQSIPCNALTEIEVWMMCSVALVEERTLDVLASPREIIKICEEYANGGIKMLIGLNTRSGSNVSEPYEDYLVTLLDRYLPRSR